MPRGWVRGPQGQMRPLAPGACARVVMEIATGQREEHVEKPDIRGPDEPPTGPMYGPGLPFPPRPASAMRAKKKRRS